jgi:hypothetical protein
MRPYTFPVQIEIYIPSPRESNQKRPIIYIILQDISIDILYHSLNKG